MSHPALRIVNLSKRYAQQAVLQGVDLEVAPGEIFGLVGVNGAGKTSLIKCVLDFQAADEGEITLFGVDSRQAAARQPLAFLPERFVPPHYLTGEDFLKYVLKLQGAPYQQAAVLDTLAALELDQAALRQATRHYSKGMTQKLGLAACLLSNKRLYIFDEPASGLDPKAQALFKRRLQALRAAGGAVFLTSHALADVEELCDRLAILDGGRVRFIGTPAACRAQFGAPTLEQAFLACIG